MRLPSYQLLELRSVVSSVDARHVELYESVNHEIQELVVHIVPQSRHAIDDLYQPEFNVQ